MFNQHKISSFNSSTLISSLKLKAKEKVRSIFATLFKFFKHFNSFTSDKFISNIFCFFCLKNFFCWQSRFNLICFVRKISMIKRLCSKTVFQTVSVFSFARFNFIIIQSMKLKSITKTEDSAFLSRLTHSEHFLRNKDKRHCFYLTAQRTQTIIIIIRQVELIWSARRLLSVILLNDMTNLRDENFKEGRWCYDSVILNNRSWQRHVTRVDQEVFLTEDYHCYQ